MSAGDDSVCSSISGLFFSTLSHISQHSLSTEPQLSLRYMPAEVSSKLMIFIHSRLVRLTTQLIMLSVGESYQYNHPTITSTVFCFQKRFCRCLHLGFKSFCCTFSLGCSLLLSRLLSAPLMCLVHFLKPDPTYLSRCDHGTGEKYLRILVDGQVVVDDRAVGSVFCAPGTNRI